MSPAERLSILVIMGSVRPGRRCPQIARWVQEAAARLGTLAAEIVDLKDWPLPADDEPGIPASGDYRHPHTRAWSAKVAGADGIVLVSPQYNWGYPAPLKNALDHLYREWNGKPLLIVTYGGHGGGKCAKQLRQVADGLKMRAVDAMPAITIPRDAIESSRPSTQEELAPFAPSLRQALSAFERMLT